MLLRIIAAALLTATPAAAQHRAAPSANASTRRILFVGNSFTFGATTAVRNWRARNITDLNSAGYGGVPALFKMFTVQAGQNWDVSIEAQGGRSLAWHLRERRGQIDRTWDVVVLQEYSTLDPDRPGDPAAYLASVADIAQLVRARNPDVQIDLTATWSRADLVHGAQPASPWARTPIDRMAQDLRAAADRARAQIGGSAAVLPVGEAWNRAFAAGLADPNPYDGIAAGQIDLWGYDHYHASVAGYYLEALVAFGAITGIDPRTLGGNERGADELGLSPQQAERLQRIAAEQLAHR